MVRNFPGPPPPPLPTLAPTAARDLVERENALIVDVRESDEWADARIPGAVHIPLRQLLARVDEIPRDRPIIVQCRSGNRSASATRALLEEGFTNVYNLEGGLGDWAADGLPLEYGGA